MYRSPGKMASKNQPFFDMGQKFYTCHAKENARAARETTGETPRKTANVVPAKPEPSADCLADRRGNRFTHGNETAGEALFRGNAARRRAERSSWRE
jgi:hypothetical protein